MSQYHPRHAVPTLAPVTPSSATPSRSLPISHEGQSNGVPGTAHIRVANGISVVGGAPTNGAVAVATNGAAAPREPGAASRAGAGADAADRPEAWAGRGTGANTEAGAQQGEGATQPRSKLPIAAAGLALLLFAAGLTAISLYQDHSGPGTGTKSPAPKQASGVVAGRAPSGGAHSKAGGTGLAGGASGPGGAGASKQTAAGGTKGRGAGGTGPSGGPRTEAAHSGQVAGPANPSAGAPPYSTARAVNLAVPTGFGPVLRQAWVAANPGGLGINAGDVRSTLPGSVFYASQPSLGAYWAISSFVPTGYALSLGGEAAGKALLSEFSKVAAFYKASAGTWSYVGASTAGSCPAGVPAPVYVAWGICATSVQAATDQPSS